MNRRAFLSIAVPGLASLSGCATLAETTGVARGSPGEGPLVSTERTVDDDSIEYLDETNEVRYVSLRSGDEPVAYETEPFEKWAKRKCASVGSSAVLPAIDRRIEKPIEGVGKGVESRLFGLVISVDHAVSRDRDGSVMSKPNVEFDELVAVAPREAQATVVLNGHDFTRNVPVIVQRVEYQLQ